MAVAGAAAVAYWAATALAVAGTAYSAYNARQMGKAQAAQANENAKMAESQGRVEAERIRELGKKQASSARAKMAAQGLDLNAENTVTEEIEEDIDLNATKDAWTTFFNRKNQAGQFRTDAANYRLQALIRSFPRIILSSLYSFLNHELILLFACVLLTIFSQSRLGPLEF